MHYGTFPIIEDSPNTFIEKINKKESIKVLQPGEFINLDEYIK